MFVRIRVVTHIISYVHFGCGKTAVTDGKKKNHEATPHPAWQRARSRRAVQFDVAPGGEFYLAGAISANRRASIRSV